MSTLTVETLRGSHIYDNTCGTHLVGNILCTRHELEQVFGAPSTTELSGDGKVTTEWVIAFSDGKIATIYDWKRYEMGAPDMYELEDWHIGGHDYDVADRIRDLMTDASLR